MLHNAKFNIYPLYMCIRVYYLCAIISSTWVIYKKRFKYIKLGNVCIVHINATVMQRWYEEFA